MKAHRLGHSKRLGRYIIQLLLLIGFTSSIKGEANSTSPDDPTCNNDHSQTCTYIDTMPPSSNKMLYSVILPTYNERENLPLITQFLHDTFTSSNLNYELVIVDDSSPDNTLAVAQSLQSIFVDRIKIVSRPGKLGLGTAYSAGLAQSSGQRIILMDMSFTIVTK